MILITFIIGLSACSTTPLNPLANTEWATSDGTQGLKFYEDYSVLFFSQIKYGSGTYSIDGDVVYLKNLSVVVGYTTSEFTKCTIEGDQIKLDWHVIGERDNYYMMLTKIR